MPARFRKRLQEPKAMSDELPAITSATPL
jgi:hypothetical protein